MDITYNTSRTAVKIVGDHSPHPIFADAAVVEGIGGPVPTYHEIKRLANMFLLPRMGSSVWPFTERDLRYARENERLGQRHWQWYHNLEGQRVQQSTGYDFVNGYGYEDSAGITLVNANDDPVYVIGG